MAIACLLLSSLLAQTQPGPIDGLQANTEAIKARVEYEFHEGIVDAARGTAEQFWKPSRPVFVPIAKRSYRGQWDSDGHAERFEFHPDPIAWSERPPIAGPSESAEYWPVPQEVLFDGKRFAHHDFALHPGASDSSLISVLGPETSEVLPEGAGPFVWNGLIPLRAFLARKFPGITPHRRLTTRNGHPVEMEVFEIAQPENSSYRFQVCYDPSIGFVPRYLRGVSHFHGKTFVREFLILRADPCRTGGFIPTEWYRLGYSLADFEKQYPSYDDDTPLAPTSEPVSVGHFFATNLVDRSEPVSMEHVGMIRAIDSPQGWVTLDQPFKTITLEQIAQKVGPLKKQSSVSLPPLRVDEQAQQQFPQQNTLKPSLFGLILAILSIGLVVGATLYWVRSKRRTLPTLLILFWPIVSGGCAKQTEPHVLLEASFIHNLFVYKSNMHWLAVTLVVKNYGNVPVRSDKIDGGCSCRKVDNSKLPAVIEPNGSLAIPVELQAKSNFSPLSHVFSLTTNQGLFTVEAPIITLAEHVAEPPALSNTLLDDSSTWTAEFTHRVTKLKGEKTPTSRLVVPANFSVIELSRVSGTPSGLDQLEAEDIHYRITLNDNKTVGLSRDEVKFVDEKGISLLEIPLVWQRIPFLSTSPSSIILGDRPYRVFLRCPDESVELLRVVNQPDGVIATVSSARELSVRLRENAPSVISGHIEVETTVANRPNLKVQVIRYAPRS